VFAVAHQRDLNVSHLASKLKCVSIVAAVLGSFLLLRLQYNMARYRARLDKMDATYFTDPELESAGLTGEEIHDLRNQTRRRRIEHFINGWEFTAALLVVLWGGWILVFWTL